MNKVEDPVVVAADIRRSQSSLELLSNTAAWKNVVENQHYEEEEEEEEEEEQRASTPPTSTLARVSPTEQGILKTSNSFSGGYLDFRSNKDVVGLSLDEASIVNSPSSFVGGGATSLMNNNNNNPNSSSASLVSSTSSNNLPTAVVTLPTFTSTNTTSTWSQQLNPNMQAAFTPPRSNFRASFRHSNGGGSARSPHDLALPPRMNGIAVSTHHHHHHPSSNTTNTDVLMTGGRQGSSDDNESWSFAGASLDSAASSHNNNNIHHPCDPLNSNNNNNMAVNTSNKHVMMEMEALRQENEQLKAKLKERDTTIANLKQDREELESRVEELRQLPTGKISQIPIEDMLDLMRTYGSEVSDTVMPPRKTKIQKASVIRQFRRWNPNFLEYFQYKYGRWVPKLGKEAELKRREEVRCQRRAGEALAAPSSACMSDRPHSTAEV